MKEHTLKSRQDFYTIHVGAVPPPAPLVQKKSGAMAIHWILAPTWLAWGVWTWTAAFELINVVAFLTVGAILAMWTTVANMPTHAEELHVTRFFQPWFSHIFRPRTPSVQRHDDSEWIQTRLRRTVSTSSSESDFEYAVRCSESTVAIDDDYEMYQEEILHQQSIPEEDDDEWVSTPSESLNSWLVSQPEFQPEYPPVQPPAPVKRKRADSTTMEPPVTKRITKTPVKRILKSSLCRSPEIRRMMEDLERMQDEGDALVMAAEAVGIGARCTMNERLRRLGRL
ncbi:unnamed protein product [Aphanomyces euteiches]|uniref:Uncharacterized protein n=1 Tax=Aphanomyces euteiches TaxID=100861 RepID=A0A6G0XSK2_9STRA|nr:hypothetical protein Ae201684_001724 [Aphanomyces euteiches]KAH9075435.1 hypothetical protein Ae201684P_004115 [Aphanomyces euteiches]KAH9156115.1 hypothetical protein AeRB84_001974 [Aphanomyces euteiches]